MNVKKITYKEPILLFGGGDVSQDMVNQALDYAKIIIAADGGANKCAEMNLTPSYIIGDMDSVVSSNSTEKIHIPEQDTTDFEKCLYTIDAPLIIGVGFLGRRQDHTFAVLNTLVRYADQKVILLGTHDVIFAAPKKIHLDVTKNSRFSLVPLKPIKGIKSSGLEWPIDNIDFSPAGMIGTSNITDAPQVHLEFDQAGMLVMLPADALKNVVMGIT